MVTSRFYSGFFVFVVLLLVGGMIGPALAAEGKLTAGYRGSGWYYVGETIVFNGLNSVGNSTLIRITGPGLPSAGVPPYNLDGTAGSGNKAGFVEGNTWSFVWDTSRVDQSVLRSGKYTVTVWDDEFPGITTTTTITLKQPEFYLKANPSTAVFGEYINLDGMAEKGVSYIKINVSDATGNVVHTFMSPVSTTGSFSYSFHVDMAPGQYYVTGTNPSMTNTLKLTLTITGDGATGLTTTTTVAGKPVTTTEPAGAGSVVQTVSQTTSASGASVTRAGISTITPILALALFGAVAFLCLRKKSP